MDVRRDAVRGRPSVLPQVKASILDEIAPARNLCNQTAVELHGRAADRLRAIGRKLIEQIGRACRTRQLCTQFVDDRGGVPAGASHPCHVVVTYVGTPDSATVGTSGMTAERLELVTASTRARPALT